MNRLAAALILFTLGGCASAGRDEVWVPLFNGRNLDGWTPKIRGYAFGENHADTFRVEDGVIRVAYDGYEQFDGRFGHLFFDGVFSSYRLRVEYRFTGDQLEGGPEWAFRNSGVMVHGQAPQTMSLDQEFPASIEVQLLGGSGTGERSTANLCTPGTNVVMGGELVTRHCTDSTSDTFHGDEWVTVEIEVRGSSSIRHFVNGEPVLEYERPQLDTSDPDAMRSLHPDSRGWIETSPPNSNARLLELGTISIQSESHPVEFRRIEIMELE